jgi:hypothetical protein
MTESGYRPEYADPQGAQYERLVFVDPLDPQAREFHVGADQRIGADDPDVNQAVEDAYRAVRLERDEAAARTPEQGASDAELAQAIDWNAAAVEATRDYVEANGF